MNTTHACPEEPRPKTQANFLRSKRKEEEKTTTKKKRNKSKREPQTLILNSAPANMPFVPLNWIPHHDATCKPPNADILSGRLWAFENGFYLSIHFPAQILVSDTDFDRSAKGQAEAAEGAQLLAMLERSSSLELADVLLSPRIFFSPT